MSDTTAVDPAALEEGAGRLGVPFGRCEDQVNAFYEGKAEAARPGDFEEASLLRERLVERETEFREKLRELRNIIEQLQLGLREAVAEFESAEQENTESAAS